MNIIECKNLTKEYLSGENTVVALNDVSLEFEKGEFCAITGPSGSGKSTFLHVLSSLENATSGEVIYNNESLKNYNDNQLSILRRRRFGFVFQAYNLVEELTGYENILLPIMLDKKKPDEEYLKKIIDILGIEDRLSHLPSALSGGQQQRVAIARALAKNPKLLLCDEPTGALDYVTGKQILKLLQDTCKQHGMTVIIITHNLALCPMGDVVLRVKSGKIVNIEKNEKPVDVATIEW